MKKISKNIIYLFYLILFGVLIIVSYNSSKRKPDSVSELYTDFSWFIFHLTVRWLVGGESPERDDYNLGRFNRVRAP
mgnify:CR=1 FL=1